MNAIDLFCGAGGLSLGAARAGFTMVAGVEWDKNAMATHQLNFPKSKHLQLDIGKLIGQQLLDNAGVVFGELAGLIGGPPCQGFSSIGRGDPKDVRNSLFGHFMRLVRETEPHFFLAENVPGILHPKNDNVRNSALAEIPDFYQVLAPIEVQANHYGAPTIRKRMFFIGIDTRRLPPLDANDFAPAANTPLVTVKDALLGLASYVPSNTNDGEHTWHSVDELPHGAFFSRVQGRTPKGVGNSMALERYRSKREVTGHIGTLHSSAIQARYGNLAPGATDPISRSVRLKLDGFSPTLRAGTGPEKGSFQAVRPIHPTMPRVITPREAARLQGFPDWFLLPPTKWHSFRQIGNSVSPLVAEAVLKVIHRHATTHRLS